MYGLSKMGKINILKAHYVNVTPVLCWRCPWPLTDRQLMPRLHTVNMHVSLTMLHRCILRNKYWLSNAPIHLVKQLYLSAMAVSFCAYSRAVTVFRKDTFRCKSSALVWYVGGTGKGSAVTSVGTKRTLHWFILQKEINAGTFKVYCPVCYSCLWNSLIPGSAWASCAAEQTWGRCFEWGRLVQPGPWCWSGLWLQSGAGSQWHCCCCEILQ